MQLPETDATYRHYKNKQCYTVVGIATHSETHESMVVYQAQYDDSALGQKPLFVRPLTMFMETVFHEGEKVPRFKKLSD